MKGSPRWWDVMLSPVKDEAGAHFGYLAVSRDVTESQLIQEKLDVAARELRHRLKNTYAMVASIVRCFARGDEGRTVFADEIARRLVALAQAQSFPALGGPSGTLDVLIRALVDPFANQGCAMVVEDIPAIEVSQGIADAIAIVMGELAVNSAKYGAIRHGGEIAVRGVPAPSGFSVRWSETSQVPVAATTRKDGQGLRLLDRIVQLRGGTLDLGWRGDGLDVTLSFAGQSTDAGAPKAGDPGG